MGFALRTSAFQQGQNIPTRYTCDGENLAPPLAWSDPPVGTRSFALILNDPDAPSGTFTHWLQYDIPPTTMELQGQPCGRTLGNDFGRTGYGGPCPPKGHGPHRYVFTVYALDVDTLDVHGKNREALERALHPHTLSTARLMGRYERSR